MSCAASHQTIHPALPVQASTMHHGGAAAGTLSSDEATGEAHV